MSARALRASGHRFWALAVTIVLVVACSSNPAATPSPAPAPNTAWENILERIGPDGEVDAELAMDAFAVAFSPLPGRVAPPGERTLIDDGTLAVDWILQFWDQLTPEQQAFADALIHGRQPGASPPPAANVNAVALGIREPRVLLAAEPVDWQSLFESMVGQVAAKFGRVYTGTLDVEIVQSQIDVPDAGWNSGAWALSQDALGKQAGPAQFCTIYIPPKGLTWTGADAAYLMAHELFHCFDYDLGQIAPHHKVSAWVKEGAAVWGAADIVGSSPQITGWWTRWLEAPDKSLYGRAYDAIGIYALLQLTGVDPWSIMDDFLLAAFDGNEAAFAVLYAVGGEAFLDTWGPRYWDDAAIGELWIYGGAGFKPDLVIPSPIDIDATAGSAKTVAAPFRAASVFRVEANADVVVIRSEGSNGFAFANGRVSAWEIEQVPVLCTVQGGCICPDGSPATGISWEYVERGSLVVAGATGNPAVGLVTVAGYSLDDFCQRPDEPNDDGPCGDQVCPTSNGDPHLTTLDGHDYDFQAVGEFTLLRSDDGSFEIQARQEPWPDSDWVSINTAAAVGLGEDRVALYLAGTVRLLVNGQEVDLTADTFAGDLEVKPVTDGFEINASDGTVVWFVGMGRWGLNVVVAPSDELRASGVGLMGPAGDGELPALPDGSAVTVGADARAAIYDVLAEGWAVTPENSLFDYDAGQGPQTFRDPSVPTADAPLSFNALPLAQQQTGLSACASVDDDSLREQCAFDVAVTGDSGFVAGYESTESVVATGLVAIPTSPPDGTPEPLPGEDECAALTDEQILQITGYAVLEKRPGINSSGQYAGGCVWSLDGEGLDWTHDLYLNVLTPDGRASFDQYLVDWPDLEHVPNLGDDAVLDVGNSSVAVKGDTRVDVQYVNVLVDSQEAERVLIELVRAALAHY